MKRKEVQHPKKPPLTTKKYVRNKVILIALILLLGLVLYIDSKTGFIKSLVGDKTIEFRIRK